MNIKKITCVLFILIVLGACKSKELVFNLGPSQSMSITGKGPGQDAAVNPYSDTNSVAIIINIGNHDFSVRIQNNGRPIKRFTVKPTEKKEVSLALGQELYFDSNQPTKAKVKFIKPAKVF